MLFRTKIILSMFLIAIIPLLTFGLLADIKFSKKLKKEVYTRLDSLAILKFNVINRYFYDLEKEIKVIQDYYNIKTHLVNCNSYCNIFSKLTFFVNSFTKSLADL